MIDLSIKETSALTPDSYVKASDVRLNSGLEGKRGRLERGRHTSWLRTRTSSSKSGNFQMQVTNFMYCSCSTFCACVVFSTFRSKSGKQFDCPFLLLRNFIKQSMAFFLFFFLVLSFFNLIATSTSQGLSASHCISKIFTIRLWSFSYLPLRKHHTQWLCNLHFSKDNLSCVLWSRFSF